MRKLRHWLLLPLFTALLLPAAHAQDSRSAFTLLRLPNSSHVSALGGENVSLIDDAPAVGRHNPALLANVSDKTLSLGFMSYAADAKLMSVDFVKAFGERHTASVAAHYLNYGEIDETDASGIGQGTFTPSDLVISLAYSYLMSDFVSGGAALKTVYSRYGSFSSVALAVDLGLNYYDPDKDLSLSLVAKNIGRQVKAFDEQIEHLPFNLQAGATLGLQGAPFKFSLTLTDLTRWKTSDYFTEEEKISTGKMLMNHLVVGVDIVPTETMYISAGYNFRRAYELKQAGSGHGAGLNFGAGLRLKRIKFGASYSKYAQSATSLMFNLAYAFK